MIDAARDSDSMNSDLARGDALATIGDWPAAIRAWDAAALEQPAMRPRIERRLRWFLTETGTARSDRARLGPLILTFVAATVLGMAFLMIAGTPGTRAADLWAVAIWIAVAVAVVAALVAARRSGGEPLDRLLDRARQTAERLDSQPARGETL
jgi:hypothetical protein